jgi:hypothetical protein
MILWIWAVWLPVNRLKQQLGLPVKRWDYDLIMNWGFFITWPLLPVSWISEQPQPQQQLTPNVMWRG